MVDISSGSKVLYHSKIENWSKFKPSGVCGPASEPCRWLVTDKQGIKYYYGYTVDSRIEAIRRGGAVRVWALNRVEDLHGNYYTIRYLEDPNGTYYPDVITYTMGNGLTESNARTISFLYESRPDAKTLYYDGSKTLMNKRIANIEVASRGTYITKL